MSGWLVVTRQGRTFVTEPQAWPNCMFCNRTPTFSWTFQLESLIGNVVGSLEFCNRKARVCYCAQSPVFSFSPKFPNRQVSFSNHSPPPKKKTVSKGCSLQGASSGECLVSVITSSDYFLFLELGQLGMYCQSHTQNCKPFHKLKDIRITLREHMLFFFNLKTHSKWSHLGPLLLSKVC